MRRWIKLWVAESLRGTIRFDFTPEERGVWYDLLALAGDCRQEGLIAANENHPYPAKWVAGVLNISEGLLERTLKKCLDSGRIATGDNGVQIVNWGRYQSEYDRQKPYREGKKEREARLEKEGKCAVCGEEGHTKYTCPSSKYGKVVQG